MFLLLIACTPDHSGTIPVEPSHGWTATADTGFDSTSDDTAADDTGSQCYVLEGQTEMGCYTTRPYLDIEMELAVPVYNSTFVAWDVTVDAAPEGWIGMNSLSGVLSFHDAHGTGWTEDLVDSFSYTDEDADVRTVRVAGSNTGETSVVAGDPLGAEDGWAVSSVEAGDTVVVTFALNIQDLGVQNGDWVQFDLNPFQTWSSAEAIAVESQFGEMPGTRFLFL